MYRYLLFITVFCKINKKEPWSSKCIIKQKFYKFIQCQFSFCFSFLQSMSIANKVLSTQSYDVRKVRDFSTGSIVDAGGLVSGSVHAWKTRTRIQHLALRCSFTIILSNRLKSLSMQKFKFFKDVLIWLISINIFLNLSHYDFRQLTEYSFSLSGAHLGLGRCSYNFHFNIFLFLLKIYCNWKWRNSSTVTFSTWTSWNPPDSTLKRPFPHQHRIYPNISLICPRGQTKKCITKKG